MTITKILTENDLGRTGAHQAGIHVPKKILKTGIFAQLPINKKNPRAQISAQDEQGRKWMFTFIYYNNKFFGGTRNEARITGITSFFKNEIATPGDLIIFQRKNGKLNVKIQHHKQASRSETVTLAFNSSWRAISI
jgi:hypothetical protein